jgi:hypothetical protein
MFRADDLCKCKESCMCDLLVLMYVLWEMLFAMVMTTYPGRNEGRRGS